MDPLKMYLLLNMGIFHCYVSLPEGKLYIILYNDVGGNVQTLPDFQGLSVCIW